MSSCSVKFFKQAVKLIWKLLKIIWYIAYVVSWLLLEVVCMLVVLTSTWILQKVYCCIGSKLYQAGITEETHCNRATTATSRVAPRTSCDARVTSHGKVSSSTVRRTSKPLNSGNGDNLRCDKPISVVPKLPKRKTAKIPSFTQPEKTILPSERNIQIYDQISTKISEESTSSEAVDATAAAATETVTKFSGDSCFLTSTKAQFNSVQPEPCQKTAVTGAASSDKSCTKKPCSAAVPESLPSSSSSVVAKGEDDTTSLSTSAASPREESSSSTAVADVINPVVKSSVRNTPSESVCRPSNSAASIPVKFTPVATIRPITNPTIIQADTVEPRPVNSASKAAQCHVTQFVQPSSTLSSPNIILKQTAAPANQSSDTSKTPEHAATTAVENIYVKPVSCTNEEKRAKNPNSVINFVSDSCGRNDGKDTVVCSSLSSLSMLSSHTTCSNVQSNSGSSLTDTTHFSTSSVANTGTNQTDKHAQFPLGEAYEFQLVCDICFKPKTEQMTMGVRPHSCRQDMLAVKEVGTSQWHWIRERKPYIRFKGNYQMCIKHQYGRPNSCYNGCTYAHCDAERRLWDLEKQSAFGISEFISAHRKSAPICNVESLLNKYPVNRSSVFLFVITTELTLILGLKQLHKHI